MAQTEKELRRGVIGGGAELPGVNAAGGVLLKEQGVAGKSFIENDAQVFLQVLVKHDRSPKSGWAPFIGHRIAFASLKARRH
jgi:hypothetical protein